MFDFRSRPVLVYCRSGARSAHAKPVVWDDARHPISAPGPGRLYLLGVRDHEVG